MTVRTMVGAIRFTAAVYMELHRVCRRWWAEETDRAEGKR